jgi:hypothetical protein
MSSNSDNQLSSFVVLIFASVPVPVIRGIDVTTRSLIRFSEIGDVK